MSVGPTLRPVLMLLLRLPLFLVLSLVLVMSSAPTIMSAAAPVPPCLLVVTLTVVVP